MTTPTFVPLQPTNHAAALIPDPDHASYEAVRYNAMKHGVLSRYTVLSHENHADYESLVNSLMDEHLPAGATEQHLIEELASVIWRKRRVLQAEVWAAANLGGNLAAKVCNGNSHLRAMGVLEGARRASANTPMARGAGDLGVVN